jgi:nucleoside-diphosphate-sugar epimerase
VAITRVKALVTHPDRVLFARGDIRDRAALDALFAAHAFHAVIHFAALKASGIGRGEEGVAQGADAREGSGEWQEGVVAAA